MKPSYCGITDWDGIPMFQTGYLNRQVMVGKCKNFKSRTSVMVNSVFDWGKNLSPSEQHGVGVKKRKTKKK